MLAEIEKDKRYALNTLKVGIEDLCADNITEVLINLDTGTCDYVELIPVLEEISLIDWFYYFDDNGAGGMPHADYGRKTNFHSWALKAIANIRENAALESSDPVHQALKSNDTNLIRLTLERLTYQQTDDQSLLPVLEKIARKDVYKKYSYIGGFETHCHLGELARDVISRIRNSMHSPDRPAPNNEDFIGRCPVCSALPDVITANTGRGEYLPATFSQLIKMDNRGEFRRCPACKTYFIWADISEMYGTGNNDEERLVRLSPEKSQALHKLFTADQGTTLPADDVNTCLHTLSLDEMIAALRFHLYNNPELIRSFVPGLITLLKKSNDTSLWDFLSAYVSNKPERAREIIETVGEIVNPEQNRISQLIKQCRRVI